MKGSALLGLAALAGGASGATVRQTLDLRDWVVDYLRPTLDLPDSPRKVPYEIPRSVSKAALLANGEYPGTAIVATEGDWVEVTVVNHMLSNDASIHWHGVHMVGTPWADGVRGVTQGPIIPGANYTYRFKAEPAGTHFWHAHYEAQMMDRGLRGPIVIHAKEDPFKNMYTEERIVVLSDEWQNPDVCLRSEGALPGNPVCSEIDRASFNGHYGNGSAAYPWPEIEVEQGKCYRFRWIGMMGQAQNYQMSITGHSQKMISYDGADLEPLEVSQFNLHAGERVDTVFCADQAAGAYVITATYDLACFLVHGKMGPISPTLWKMNEVDACSFYAVLKYKGATTPGPSELPFGAPNGTGGGATPAAVNATTVDLGLRDDWAKLVPLTPKPLPAEPSHRYVVNIGIKAPEYEGAATPYASSYRMYMFTEEKSWSMPETPLLFTKNSCGTNGAPVLEIPENASSVEIVLNNLSPTAHVLHLHGMRFQVVNYAEYSQTWCSQTKPQCFFTPRELGWLHCPGDLGVCDENDKNIDNGNCWGCKYNAQKSANTQFDLSRAVEKDMISIWRRSWAVIRIPNVNPGYWTFHCHMEQHIPTGQLMVFGMKKSEIPAIPKDVPRAGSCPVFSD